MSNLRCHIKYLVSRLTHVGPHVSKVPYQIVIIYGFLLSLIWIFCLHDATHMIRWPIVIYMTSKSLPGHYRRFPPIYSFNNEHRGLGSTWTYWARDGLLLYDIILICGNLFWKEKHVFVLQDSDWAQWWPFCQIYGLTFNILKLLIALLR